MDNQNPHDGVLILPGRQAFEAASARRFVRTYLPELPPRLRLDVELAAFELVKDAVTHGRTGPLTLRVHSDRSQVSVRVASEWVGGDSEEPKTPGIDAVRELADELDITRRWNQLAIRAMFRVDTPHATHSDGTTRSTSPGPAQPTADQAGTAPSRSNSNRMSGLAARARSGRRRMASPDFG